MVDLLLQIVLVLLIGFGLSYLIPFLKIQKIKNPHLFRFGKKGSNGVSTSRLLNEILAEPKRKSVIGKTFSNSHPDGLLAEIKAELVTK